MTPLAGRRVLVTRPREQAGELVDRLRALGADPLVAPLIRIAPPLNRGPLLDAAARAGSFDWIVLTSVNAVDALMAALVEQRHPVSVLSGARICAIGPATAQRLREQGAGVDLIPAESRAEGVVAAMSAADTMRGRSVLLPRADIGRELIASALRAAGADVTEVAAYRTVEEDRIAPEVSRMLEDGQIDVVTFTSGSAVRSFAHILGADRAAGILRRASVAVIGPTTAEAVGALGLTAAIQPDTYTVPALVDAIAAHFRAGQGRARLR